MPARSEVLSPKRFADVRPLGSDAPVVAGITPSIEPLGSGMASTERRAPSLTAEEKDVLQAKILGIPIVEDAETTFTTARQKLGASNLIAAGLIGVTTRDLDITTFLQGQDLRKVSSLSEDEQGSLEHLVRTNSQTNRSDTTSPVEQSNNDNQDLAEMLGVQTTAHAALLYLASERIASLTATEMHVLSELGPTSLLRSNAEIAEVIGRGENTIKTHVKSVFRKLGVGTKAQAVDFYNASIGKPSEKGLSLEGIDTQGYDGAKVALLTDTERTVLDAIFREPRSSTVLAEALGRSVNTIDTHIKSACGKLGVSNRLDAARIAHAATEREMDTSAPVQSRPKDVLSSREREVFDLRVAGTGQNDISTSLDLSPKTVKNYLLRSRSKLGRSSLAEAIGAEKIKSLSPVEIQVLSELTRTPLLASHEGIADALSLSRETVRTHLKRIRRKLGGVTREQAGAIFRTHNTDVSSSDSLPDADLTRVRFLTPKERAAVVGVLDGTRTRQKEEIAAAAGVSVNTIKTHTSHAIDKLGVRNRREAALVVRAAGEPQESVQPDVLTPRERLILQFRAYGSTPSQIAEMLKISGDTVKTHLSNARRKLGATRLRDAIKLYRETDENFPQPEAV